MNMNMNSACITAQPHRTLPNRLAAHPLREGSAPLATRLCPAADVPIVLSPLGMHAALSMHCAHEVGSMAGPHVVMFAAVQPPKPLISAYAKEWLPVRLIRSPQHRNACLHAAGCARGNVPQQPPVGKWA